jgi:UDP-GlcNAc:undecaprenyl-phosphate GlcNAc-1-phosphate transferase
MTTYLCVYLGSFVLALVVTPLVIRMAYHINAVAVPGVRTIHTRPVPRIGGVAIFLAAVCLVVPVLFLDNRIGEDFRAVRGEVISLLGAAGFIFLIGLIDDLKGLPARFKFLVELIVASALYFVGIRINSIAVTGDLVLHLGGWGFLLTVLWMVGVTNAVNLSDGLDGLAAGISAVACAVISILAIQDDIRVLAVLMLALAGGLCGFLLFNFNPARVFMGDCGSLFIGFTIAASSVMCVAKTTAFVGLALPALALGIPIFDTLFSMVRRFLERRSLFAPDRSHFHHRLLDLGLRHRHVVIAIYLATLLATGLGSLMLISEGLDSLIIFGCILFLIVLLFRAVGAVRLRETLAGLRANSACLRRERDERRTFEFLQLRFRQAGSDRDRWQAICEAAQQLELAWVSLRTTLADGSVDTSVWRRPGTPAKSPRIITMQLPIVDSRRNRVMEFEVAILVNHSLESASHRASLFNRLIEEHASFHGTPQRRSGATPVALPRDQAIADSNRMSSIHPRL